MSVDNCGTVECRHCQHQTLDRSELIARAA